MHHCTHLHSIFYPACLVECYTYSIYRGKNRKGQISRKENVHLWVSFSAEAVMSLPRWLWPGSRRGCNSMAKPSLGTRRSDKQICWELRSPRPTVWSLNGCFHLLSVALYSSRVHTIAPPDSLPVLLLCNLTDCLRGRRARPAAAVNTPWAQARVPWACFPFGFKCSAVSQRSGWALLLSRTSRPRTRRLAALRPRVGHRERFVPDLGYSQQASATIYTSVGRN